MARQKVWKMDFLAPITSTSTRTATRRTANRNARKARSHVNQMYAEQAKYERAERRAEQGPRHFYGAWTPYGWGASIGGHPGRALRRAHHHVRRHARRILTGKFS